MTTKEYPIDGYYAKTKTGLTLYQFEWDKNDKLFLLLDDNTKKEVDPKDYIIIELIVKTNQ